ncbi:MAG: hypothetical protein ACFFDN_30100 [Candidatus Hodarchaeota archaeon]
MRNYNDELRKLWERLEEVLKKMTFQCLYCGTIQKGRDTKFHAKPHCKKCGSGFVASLESYDPVNKIFEKMLHVYEEEYNEL